MVSIQSRYTIIPSSPTPNQKLFSLIEQIKLRTHVPLLYVYKPHNNNYYYNSQTLIEILRTSLSQALVIYYPLAGRLRWINENQWEIDCNSKGALLLEAKCKQVTSLNDLGDFVPTHLVSLLIPNIDYFLPIEEIPLLAVQLTMFSCGGFTIGVALCRAITDGSATMGFMTTWAKLARGVRLHPTEEFPCHNRTILDSRKQSKSTPLKDYLHREFHAPPVWVGRLGDTRVDVAIVKLTKGQVVKLKKKASNNTTKTTQYSSFEVIAGHIWRCVSKARYVVGGKKGEQPTRLSTLVNCKNRLKPPLPSNYAGNAAFPTVTKTCSFNDLIEKPLKYAVGNVREAIERVTGEFVSSALDYIDNERDVKLLRYNFHYPAKWACESESEGSYKGNPNLFVVSWMNFSFKDANFGWGEPVYYGPGYMDSEGKAFVMNDSDGNGFVVAISLEASHMDVFRKLFYDDIQEVLYSSKL